MNGKNKAENPEEGNKTNENPITQNKFDDLSEEEQQKLLEEFFPDELEEKEEDDFITKIFKKA